MALGERRRANQPELTRSRGASTAGAGVITSVRFERPVDRDDELRSVATVRFLDLQSRRCVMIDGEGPPDPAAIATNGAIEEAGLRPRDRHHEIYLGDPRRSAPERLKTILRQPFA
jgi:hypothetical protein